MTPVMSLNFFAQNIFGGIFMNFYIFMGYDSHVFKPPDLSTCMTDIATFLSWQDGLDFLPLEA